MKEGEELVGGYEGWRVDIYIEERRCEYDTRGDKTDDWSLYANAWNVAYE